MKRSRLSDEQIDRHLEEHQVGLSATESRVRGASSQARATILAHNNSSISETPNPKTPDKSSSVCWPSRGGGS